MSSDIQRYIESQTELDQLICLKLSEIINENLRGAESKVWHAHPVWFLEENPIVGYNKQKKGIRLSFGVGNPLIRSF